MLSRASRSRAPWSKAACSSVALALALAAAVLAPKEARGQDLSPPLPNVLLLLDTSGSMERMINGSDPNDVANNASLPSGVRPGRCLVGTSSPPGGSVESTPNRWGRVLQVLTGSVQPYYACYEQSRSRYVNGTTTNPFVTEFQITTGSSSSTTFPPYDMDYFLPYHRPVSMASASATGLSSACVYGPGRLPGLTTGGVGPYPGRSSGGAAWAFPTDAIVQRYLGKGSSSDAVTLLNASLADAPDATLRCFDQLEDGILDTTGELIRFGLMTFDGDNAAGVGVEHAGFTSSSPRYVTGENPFLGGFSYFRDWNVGTSYAATGRPQNCDDAPSFFENGARNPAAPPWEGRLIGFDDIGATTVRTSSESLANNQRIQQAILAARPYGATPIAGMLSDARQYYYFDPAGPHVRDPLVNTMTADGRGCRKEYVILLTDGAPNMDLRPACTGTTSNDSPPCPFQRSEDIAREMANGGPGGAYSAVKTFVIGFAVTHYTDSGLGVVQQCSALRNPPQDCQSNDPAYTACCNLQRIAEAGGTERAYFAETEDDLQRALEQITSLIASQTTTRTTPSYSPVASGSGGAASSNVFLASFLPNVGSAWSGNIQRKRFVCSRSSASEPFTVAQPTLDVSKGDDFAANLNLEGNSSLRRFIAVQPTGTSLTTENARSNVRPYARSSAPDTLGQQAITEVGQTASNVISTLTASSALPLFGITSSDCLNRAGTSSLGTATCAERALRYALAQPTMSLPSDYAKFKDRSTNAFGDIFKATPAVVGPASALLRDEGYQGFRNVVLPNYQAIADSMVRVPGTVSSPTIVYAATNDGLLHAFLGDIDQNALNEAWAMLIPGVLPSLKSAYNARQPLLDGAPVVRDVIWERTRDTVRSASTAVGAWHTMLVAGFGSSAGYYGVDVTDPNPASWRANSATGGPHFRWQLGRLFDSSGAPSTKQLFGTYTGTPAIATVFVKGETQNDPPREIGVAILPGGSDGPSSSTAACDRLGAVSGNTTALPLSDYPARSQVRCWGATNSVGDPVNGRSVTIVRIDNGEILRVFMRDQDSPGYSDRPSQIPRTLVNHAPFDSPMTGTPVVFPSDTGSVAQKFYVGDADGTVWRFDVSDPDPANWRAEIFLDLYTARGMTAAQTLTSTTNPAAWRAGEPIQIQPVVALGPRGTNVVGVASGTTDEFTSTGVHFVYSVEEEVLELQGTRKPRAKVNWYVPLVDGERVSGPMAIFDSVLYFATFKATPSTAACSQGEARLYGRDYVTPQVPSNGDTSNPSAGGVPRLQAPSSTGNPPQYIVSQDVAGTSSRGRVIPGVSINVTPTCADTTGVPVNDPVTGIASYQANNIQEGQYSLYAQIGASTVSGGRTSAAVLDLPLPTPRTQTRVDSWAAVVE